ncbi:MAG: DUF5107 domain-containing protein [Propionibacteriaceae bacterium]|nr:DUF5107 domain-containing protein [Propionibacteriaceae bacterium]
MASSIALPPRPEALAEKDVAAWAQSVNIDTFAVGEPDPYPEFFSTRVYQGSSGKVFPLPFFESVSSTASPRAWQGIHLENEYVRLMLLPELGGRIHIGMDRTNNYDFFYRNNVIKPALVGLTGPWISGGMEFNWPQHHRPATYLPVDWTIEEEPDGAVTVWCSDLDPMARMKGMHGVRLRPHSSLIEVRVRLFNRTECPQTFLWWANAAAKVGDDYQSFFPPDVTMVADHAKRACATFPRVSGRYYGVDYPARVDADHPDADRLDWYRNIPVPTSYMIVDTNQDFFGGYDHGQRSGFVYWADHRIAPGKKQWTWGNAPFGWAWDRQLTDSDGPYVELMAGAFTDNQPDFSYLMPGETKVFSQYWYPIRDIGVARSANRETAVSLEPIDAGVRLGVAVTRPRIGLSIRLSHGDATWETTEDLAPDKPFTTVVSEPWVGARLEVVHEGTVLLEVGGEDAPSISGESGAVGRQEVVEARDVFSLATPLPEPDAIDSVEELALSARHLLQYRHATCSPDPYLDEALGRDPSHVESLLLRCGELYKQGLFAQSRDAGLRAVARLTHRNPNPFSGEAHYRTGLAEWRLGMRVQAHEHLVKAAWDPQYRGPALSIVAADELAAGQVDEAKEHLAQGLASQPDNTRLRNLLAYMLLANEETDTEGRAVAETTLTFDPLDWWAHHLLELPFNTDPQTLLDLAGEYARLGAWDTVGSVARRAATHALQADPGMVGVLPLAWYYELWAMLRANKSSPDKPRKAESATTNAEKTARRKHLTDLIAHAESGTCQLSRLDDYQVVAAVIAEAKTCGEDDKHGVGHALMGNWLYHVGRAGEAIEQWLIAVESRPNDAVTWRNLGMAAWNVNHDPAQARRHYDRALEIRPCDSKLACESDQLDARLGVSEAERLGWLRARLDIVAQRDDLTIATADLATRCGEPEFALELLVNRSFHPWEGGEGRVLDAWESAHLALAEHAMAEGRPHDAVAHMRNGLNPPENLGEARHLLVNASHLWLALGDALEASGNHEEALLWWKRAAEFRGDFQGMEVLAYSDLTYYSVMALRRLGRDTEADSLRAGLAAYVEAQEQITPRIDYFATSLPTMLLFTEDVEGTQRRKLQVIEQQLSLL